MRLFCIATSQETTGGLQLYIVSLSIIFLRRQ
jgi:hypothetical protein